MQRKFSVKKETHEIRILAQTRVSEKRYCAVCQRQVRWLVPEEAMALAEVSLREIFRLVESHEIHFAESEEGFLIVCAESLAETRRK